MPLYDYRCACGASAVDVIARPDDQVDCEVCCLPMRRLIGAHHSRIAESKRKGGRTSLAEGAWDERKDHLGSADAATATMYDVCRESGIPRDRAREIARDAGVRVQGTAARLARAREG